MDQLRGSVPLHEIDGRPALASSVKKENQRPLVSLLLSGFGEIQPVVRGHILCDAR
jgi:hypothetical protein